ncbi:hypothetical protein PIB30_006033 [Stylosanthes scabra]|uniref:RNA helicase n=1 Tax=Stylosanthes scabra TaxID=79078 RepID=A0ABU6U5V5_9FABA|nr:hypothetical protein [Stylosanthes scabra]
MASSSASSSSNNASSYTLPLSPSNFSSLPVMAMKKKIVEKIMENRATLIVGEAGCGKSSQIPQFLLDEGLSPILCTQPRRFAVVAVAKMVAKARNCEVGEEVGYHIGHPRHISAGSKIIFKTAGVLLDELRDRGSAALKYKAIILDEVHERSVESDLVLVCVKQFLLKNNDLRVVLMSATADISRYRDYFKDLGRGERVEVLAIPISNQKIVFQRHVSYLEQVAESLGISSEIMNKYSPGGDPFTANAYIKPEFQMAFHQLIHNLVLHIHVNEPDIEKSILVFLPTYYSLEQQWRLLRPLESTFKVHILHRSIDTEQALMAMKIWKSHRKVILATNIAESSVTIPKVAFVIDSCRSLQVYWDKSRRKESSKLVWVSKSQAEQRRGRTGRTCDGHVYRLVTGSFFNKLEDHESPSILKLSLRLQVLSLCCAESKAINDPKVVDDALNTLVQMRALEKTPRGRYEPTFYGRLIASFPLSFDASVLVLKFGNAGMIREGILLGIMMDTQPLPIIHPFGEEELFARYIASYFTDSSILPGRKEMEVMANFCAFEFWQHLFKDKYRLDHLKQVLEIENLYPAKELMPKLEEEWCSIHNLSQSSLHQTLEIYDDLLSSVHRFRPKFLSSFRGLPPYFDPYGYEHTCLVTCQSDGDIDGVAADEEGLEATAETKCASVPYVISEDFHSYDVANMFAKIIKEIRAQFSEDTSSRELEAAFNNLNLNGGPSTCVYFFQGYCNRGSECLFSHSLHAKRPQCKYFFSLQGCRRGESCSFSHDSGPTAAVSFRRDVCEPEDNNIVAASLLRFFPQATNRSILILDDTDLHFATSLGRHYHPSKIISTTCLSETTILEQSLKGVKILWGLYHPYETIIAKEGKNPVPWNEVQCILWFPCFDSFAEDSDGQKQLLQNFFNYLAIRILADNLSDVKVIITINNIRFSQLKAEKLARECFFVLTDSFAYDETSFGAILYDRITPKAPTLVSRPTSYVFELHPPSEQLFGAATIRKRLYSIQEK